jgi:hypothetical protein
MKLLRFALGTSVICIFFFSTATSLVSCTKTTTVKDSLYDLADGLVAYYNFNGGNLNDSSGWGNNIVFNNATSVTDRFGNPGNAFQFNGTTSYMRVTNSASLNPLGMSIMAIVKLNGFYTGGVYGNEILMKGPSDQASGIYGLRIHPTSFDINATLDNTTEAFMGFYGDYGDHNIMDSSVLVQTGTWYTLVCTFDGFQTSLYLNGHLQKTQIQPPSFFTANTSDLYIGKTENISFPFNFNGVIDEIRIYDKALSPQLVKQLNKLTN